MYSLVADLFITTGLISDPIELFRVVGLLHGDPRRTLDIHPLFSMASSNLLRLAHTDVTSNIG